MQICKDTKMKISKSENMILQNYDLRGPLGHLT